MAKIGTAHVEIKPVLNQGALDELCKSIEDAVALAVKHGMHRHEAGKVEIREGSEIKRDENGGHFKDVHWGMTGANVNVLANLGHPDLRTIAVEDLHAEIERRERALDVGTVYVTPIPKRGKI